MVDNDTLWDQDRVLLKSPTYSLVSKGVSVALNVLKYQQNTKSTNHTVTEPARNVRSGFKTATHELVRAAKPPVILHETTSHPWLSAV
ncbi:hypothetical protein PoB_006124100 [Plakobranchus ocellatus]|uniref:Uncharacterized protein n=1 Tax=Plakobranchus ocellatus TaxID=259542 RepID=A0AAV4CS62_9GAST|nr:hypothetical protein PoB_006124100 [Plakobranchus ocellatus]